MRGHIVPRDREAHFLFSDVIEEVRGTVETRDSLAHCFAFALLLSSSGSDLMQTASNSDSHEHPLLLSYL